MRTETDSDAEDDEGEGNQSPFPVTPWTMIQQMGKNDKDWEDFWNLYWHPLFLFARRRGLSPDDAHDLVQTLVLQLCGKREEKFIGFDRGKGRMRSFLIGCLEKVSLEEARKGGALKRDPGVPILNLDEVESANVSLGGYESLTPVEAYEKALAQGLYKKVKENFLNVHKGTAQWELARCFLASIPYPKIAEISGLSLSSVKKKVPLLRRQFKSMLLQSLQDFTNTGEEELEAEWQWFLGQFDGAADL